MQNAVRRLQVKIAEALGHSVETSADVPSQATIIREVEDLVLRSSELTEQTRQSGHLEEMARMLYKALGQPNTVPFVELAKMVQHHLVEASALRTRLRNQLNLTAGVSFDAMLDSVRLYMNFVEDVAIALNQHIDDRLPTLLRQLKELIATKDALQAQIVELNNFKQGVRKALGGTAHTEIAPIVSMIEDLKEQSGAFERVEIALNQGGTLSPDEVVGIVKDWHSRITQYEEQERVIPEKPVASPFDRRAIWRQYFISRLGMGIMTKTAANQAEDLVQFECEFFGATPGQYRRKFHGAL